MKVGAYKEHKVSATAKAGLDNFQESSSTVRVFFHFRSNDREENDFNADISHKYYMFMYL